MKVLYHRHDYYGLLQGSESALQLLLPQHRPRGVTGALGDSGGSPSPARFSSLPWEPRWLQAVWTGVSCKKERKIDSSEIWPLVFIGSKF